MKLAAGLQDLNTSLSDLGVVAAEGTAWRRVRLERHLPDEALSRLTISDYLIDPNSFQIVAVQDQTHPKDDLSKDIPHAIYFADFRVVNGIELPFAVLETVNGQRIWSLQMQSITVNPKLTDSDFDAGVASESSR